MRTLLVTSLKESTGKTAITLALGKLAQQRGYSVGYMKPKGTRLQSSVGKTLDADPMLARELLDLDAEMHEMEPVVYSPTFIEGAIKGRENVDDLRDIVETRFAELADGHDLMLIEGGGNVSTGGIVDLTDADVASYLDAGVVLVAPFEDYSDVDELLAAADTLGDRLAGVVFNAVSDQQFDRLEVDVAPFLEGRGIPVLGVVPKSQELAGVTVAELAEELGAEVSTSAPRDSYVERFLVGAMGSDSALRYFRRTKDAAVITGGDRTDIQSVALEAPGVKCLILTGGFRPSGAVLGAAEDRGVPILQVQTDTLATIERAENVVRGGRTRDARTVEVMTDLLYEHADVDTLIGTGPEPDDES